MVILTSCGLQIKEKCGDLLKLVNKRKVFIMINAVDNSLKSQLTNSIENNIKDIASRVDCGELTAENISKYIDYYDCIYLAGGNIKKLSEMINHKEIKDGLLYFIDKGKTLITEDTSTLLAVDNLKYLNQITNSLDEEDKIYKDIDYSSLNNLALTKEKIIVHADKIKPHFQGACRLVERQNRLSIRFLKDGEILVL